MTEPSRRLIHLIVVGDASCYADHTLPSIVRYAQRCGARIHITTSYTGPGGVKTQPQWCRLDLLVNALNDPSWDQLLVMDVDIHVNPNSPDIFSTYPSGFNVCEDLFLKTTQSYQKFQEWLKSLGLSGPCLNGGVILTDRPSLEKIKPWLQIRPFVGPFDASDQNHENLAIKHTFPDLVPMDIRWNTPDPHSTGPDYGCEPIYFNEAYFRHALEIRGWKAKDVQLGRIAKSYRPKLADLIQSMTSILCLPRVVRLAGLHVGHICQDFQSLSHWVDAKLVGSDHLGLCDFAVLSDSSLVSQLPMGSLVVLLGDSGKNADVTLTNLCAASVTIKR